MPIQVLYIQDYEYRYFQKGNDGASWAFLKAQGPQGEIKVNLKAGRSDFDTIINALNNAQQSNFQLPPFPYTSVKNTHGNVVNYPNTRYGPGGDMTQEFAAFLQGCGVEPVFVENPVASAAPMPQAPPVTVPVVAQPVQQQPQAPIPVSQINPQPLPTAPVPVTPIPQVAAQPPTPVVQPTMAATVDVTFDNTAAMLTAQTVQQAKVIQQATNLDLATCLDAAQRIAVSALINSSR